MKIIGLDVGTRRIGVATADSAVRIAVPGTTITVNNGYEYAEIARLARAHNTNWFVLGLPRSNEGNETKQSEYVKAFARQLKKAIPEAKIKFQDESLTSVEAENRLKSRKKAYRKEEIDSEAAAIILQDFIETLAVAGDKSGLAQSTTRYNATSADRQVVKPSKEGNSSMLKKFVIILLVLVLATGIGGLVAFSWYNSALGVIYNVPNCNDLENDSRCDFIDFTVNDGDTVEIIGDSLESAGLIKSSFAFQIFMRVEGYADQVKTGDYQFRRTMDVKAIATQLKEGSKNPNVFSFMIRPGETVKDIKKDLIEVGYSTAEVEAAFAKNYRNENDDLRKLLETAPVSNQYGAEPLEGFLFGDTYEFYKTDSVEKIITTALEAMWETVSGNDLINKYAAKDLTLYQGITLASIVQREASDWSEQPKVAQVFYSRIAQNIQLGSDVTLQYALDLVDPNREIYTDNVAALELDNPYNTRKALGLTPGPICNPGVSAMLAVANPSDTSYLYFLTGDDGVMYYSYTEAEHNQNIIDKCRNLCGIQL